MALKLFICVIVYLKRLLAVGYLLLAFKDCLIVDLFNQLIDKKLLAIGY